MESRACSASARPSRPPRGFVHAKDILRASETKTDSGESITARGLARAVLTVLETRQIDAILADFQTRGEGQMAAVVDGGAPIQDVNDRLDTRFESDDVETIGGFVFSRLGRVPAVGDQTDANGCVIQVEAVDDTRIERLVIQETQVVQERDDK